MITDQIQKTQLSVYINEYFKSKLLQDFTLRVFGTHDEPMFIAKYVAEMLGYADTTQAIRVNVDNEDILTY